jgi:SAM-dependent methyltransferase
MIHALSDSCFADATADITDPHNLELAQATFNEQLLYEAIASFARGWSERTQKPARVLDLCAATGLTAKYVSEAIPICSLTLVDSDQEALEESEKNFSGADFPIHPTLADAVVFDDGGRYDLILANSAYHHIEDHRKPLFMQNASRLLAPNGAFLVGDHFLPPYSDEAGHCKAVEEFYRVLVRELELRECNPQAIQVLRSAARHGIEQNHEFKVCWSQFLSDLRSAPLKLDTYRIVWGSEFFHQTLMPVGSMAIQLLGRFDECS